MASIKPLIGFGIGFIGAGLYWKFYDDVISGNFTSYIRDVTDKYFVLSDIIWKALPFIIIFVGIVCLIFGSITTTSSYGGEE